MSETLGIWLVRAQTDALGRRVQSRLGGTLYRPWLDATDGQPAQFARCYLRHAQWLFIGASGIAVRFLDGLVGDKRSDPAMVVLDEGARYAVSLLSGHEGGANRLAYRVANTVGAVPVISTATEASKPLALGIGCRRGASAAQIEACVRLALGRRGLDEVREAATVDVKAGEPGLIEFCTHHDLFLRVFARETLAARPYVQAPSAWVRATLGVDGVCEPCALLSFQRGRLLVPKTTLDGVAVAVVEDNLELS